MDRTAGYTTKKTSRAAWVIDRRRMRRLLYAACCTASSIGILWGLIGMAKASPDHALAVLGGVAIIALARADAVLDDPGREHPRNGNRMP